MAADGQLVGSAVSHFHLLVVWAIDASGVMPLS
jgi:hypothetical protein